MGFDVSYSTTEIISPGLQREIIADMDLLYQAKAWVKCSGPSVANDAGRLSGSSRVSPLDPDGVAEARSGSQPAGSLPELLQALREISSRYDIDWEISHDHSDGPVGFIRCGVPDESVQETFFGLQGLLDDIDDEFPDENR